MTEDELRELYDNFETTWLLTSVDHVDKLRRSFSDREVCAPPKLRDDLFRLHTLSMEVVNNGNFTRAQELFDSADGIQMEISEMIESMEYIQKTLLKLLSLYPESLANAD